MECYLSLRSSSGTSKVIQHGQARRAKRNKNAKRKDPTKLVKAAAYCLLSPLTMTRNRISRGCTLNVSGGRPIFGSTLLLATISNWRWKALMLFSKTGTLVSANAISLHDEGGSL